MGSDGPRLPDYYRSRDICLDSVNPIHLKACWVQTRQPSPAPGRRGRSYASCQGRNDLSCLTQMRVHCPSKKKANAMRQNHIQITPSTPATSRSQSVTRSFAQVMILFKELGTSPRAVSERRGLMSCPACHCDCLTDETCRNLADRPHPLLVIQLPGVTTPAVLA